MLAPTVEPAPDADIAGRAGTIADDKGQE